MGKSLFGRDNTEFAVSIPALRFLGFKETRWIEVLHFRCKPTGVPRGIKQ